MKKLLNTLSIVVCILGSSLNAQTNKTAPAQPTQVQIDPADQKAKFINNQDYLSPTLQKDYRNFYGDSLKGFDEAAVKAKILPAYSMAVEYIAVMNIWKRDYINKKYKIGPYAPKPAAPPAQNTPNSKPGKTVGNGGNTVNFLPCVNEDFEQTTPGSYNNVASPVSGWTVESTLQSNFGYSLACNTPTNPAWILGSPEFSIVQTPILGHPYIGNISNSPLGGNNVALLNDAQPGFDVTRISTTFPVTANNTVFQFAFAGSWDGSGHDCCSQPFFVINMFDCTGAALNCSSVTLTPPGPNCQNGVTGYSVTGGGISYTNWQVRYIDLTPYIGSCITIRVTNGDCNGGAHHGSLYFDARCGGSAVCGLCTPPGGTTQVINGGPSFCAGSGVAQILAPSGYATYSWVAPPGSPSISPGAATLQILSISQPVAGAIYTTYVTSPSGCQFMILNTLNTTSVNISGIGSAPSCAGGASGTATVVGTGSGTGYNYTWLNSTGSVVGTASVATGLAAGVYSVILTGFGASGCGSAVATTTVGTAPPGVINVYKPFCGNAAFLFTSGGSGFQWYNMLAPVANSLGGNSPSLTVNNPFSGQIISLTYTSNLGCRDSVQYTLGSTPPGVMLATNITSVCTGGNNGTAVVNMAPAPGAPTGLNFISVGSTGSTPSYSAMSIAGTSTVLNLSGLSAGTYTISGFDGSCYYTSAFNVSTYTFNFGLSLSSAILCPGNSVNAAITFTNVLPSQFTYSWSPGTWLIGTTYSNSIVNPVTSAGTNSTIVYSVKVTPIAINCPITKNFTITAVNPPTPTISAIPVLCNTSPVYTINVSPAGGTFSTGFSGAASPIGQTNGLITPSNTNIAIGTNTFVYSISVLNCPASSVGSYTVAQVQSAALTSSVPPLCITNPAFNLMNIVQNTTGGWNGSGVSSNFFNPASVIGGNYTLTYTVASIPPANACISTTNLVVSVTQTLVPNIVQKPEFCTNAAAFSMTATPSGGTWAANVGVNASGLVTPQSIVGIANLPVSYSVTVGPCLNIGTTTLHVSQYIPATLTGVVPGLCYNSNGFNLMSIAQNPGGIWSAPANIATAINSNTFFAAGLPSGNYVLTYSTPSTPNPTLCAGHETITVSVSNPPAPTITVVGPLCNNAAVFQLSVNPAQGTWVNTPYLSNSGVFNPALATIGNNAVQYIIGTNACNRQQTSYINVEAFVPATIVSNIPDLCNNSPVVNLSPFTANTLGHWSGPGISNGRFDPASTGSGQFVLTYNTSSSPSGLCPDQGTMAVSVYSLANPIVTQLGPFCNSSLPVQLQVTPVGGIFSGASPGLISYNGLFNPAAGMIGNNIVNYSITSGPCLAYAQTVIKVERFVSADLSSNSVGPYCKTDEAVNMNSFVQNPVGSWSTLNNTPGLQGSMFNPMRANPGIDNIVIHRTESETPNLCPDTAAVRIEVREAPEVSIQLDSEKSGCAPFEAVFHIPNKNSGTGVWTINDGSDPIHSLNGNHVFTSSGSFDIQLDYVDEIGCKALPRTIMVTSYAAPKADFSMPEEIFISEPQVQLVNQSSELSGNLYQWSSPELLQSSELSPVVVFPKIGRFNITLTATSIRGCKSEITKAIEVKNNFNLFMPNSFTPNFDGLNDVFVPVYTKEGIDTKTYELEIFDRWGHSLFRSRDIAKGWDGTNKGEVLKEDTYVYKVKYKDADGNLYERTGNVSLLK